MYMMATHGTRKKSIDVLNRAHDPRSKDNDGAPVGRPSGSGSGLGWLWRWRTNCRTAKVMTRRCASRIGAVTVGDPGRVRGVVFW